MKKTIFTATALFLLSGGVFAKEANHENLFLVQLKMSDNVNYEDVVENYIRAYRNDVWSKYHNDEFEYEEKRQETISILKEKVKNVDLSEPLKIQTRAKFGDYNFKEKAYEFHPIKPGTYFKYRKKFNAGFASFYTKNMELFIDNPQVIDGIAMDKKTAKEFLNSRKNSNGYIDRSVYLRLYVVPTSVDGNSIHGDITSYEVLSKEGDIITPQNLTN